MGGVTHTHTHTHMHAEALWGAAQMPVGQLLSLRQAMLHPCYSGEVMVGGSDSRIASESQSLASPDLLPFRRPTHDQSASDRQRIGVDQDGLDGHQHTLHVSTTMPASHKTHERQGTLKEHFALNNMVTSRSSMSYTSNYTSNTRSTPRLSFL